MPYIGKTPTVGNFQVCDAISVVNGQAAYTLQVGGANVAPESANHMLVSLNGILQKPGSSFTISGSTMTFASNLATGDVIDFVQILGNVLDIGQPSDDTVKTASIQANAVTGAKLNTDVISAQTALGAQPADTDEFLVSDAGVLKRVDYSYIKGGGITSASQFRLNTNKTGNADITSGLEVVDTDGYGGIGSAVTESSGIFSFPSTGIYLILVQAYIYLSDAGDTSAGLALKTTTDNSNYDEAARASAGNNANTPNHTCYSHFLFDVTDTSTHKVKFTTASFTTSGSTQTTLYGQTNRNTTSFTFLRLGDT